MKIEDFKSIWLDPGYYYSYKTKEFEICLEPGFFGDWDVGKYDLNKNLIGQKISCKSLPEALEAAAGLLK